MKFHKIKRASWFATAVVGLFFLIGSLIFGYWLNKPYPVVTTSNSWTKISIDKPQRVGTIVAWTKPKVCVPAGTTKSYIYATTIFLGGSVSKEIANNKFILKKGYCGEPNYTSIIIPDTLPNGRYDITVEACTDNPTPIDKCVLTNGPSFIVFGQPSVLPGEQ